MIEKGKNVAIEYSVYLEDLTPVDSNVGEEPLVFTFGAHQILPALEESLQELRVGDSTRVTLSPEKAYGEVNPNAYKEIDAAKIPEDLRFEGAFLVLTDDKFGEMITRIDSLREGKAVLDFNHPLAGKTLTFDVKVLDIS